MSDQSNWKSKLRYHPCYSIIDGRCTCHKGTACGDAGKHPKLIGWPEKATADPAQVEAWRHDPTVNLGIHTGRESGVWVLECDPKKGGRESLRQLEEKHSPLPDTYVVRSGGGGTHFYFAWNQALEILGDRINNTADRLAPGLDIRAQNGNIIAPGSRHRSGNLYEVTIDNPPADAPTWLLKEIIKIFSGSGGRRKRKSRDAGSEKIGDGSRNVTLTSKAGLLRSLGIPESALSESLHAINREKFENPLPDDEVEKIIRSVCRYPEGELETPLDFTDGALLERWSRQAAPTVRYLIDDKSWFVYRDGLWSEHAVGPIYEIREFLKSEEPSADVIDDAKARDRLHHRLNSQKLVAAVKSLAPGQPELQHEAREFDPDPLLVGLPEGKVLDLRTGDVRDIQPTDLITRRLPVAPAVAESAEWLKFLEDTHPQQPEIQSFLKRWFGYCLTADVREDKILFFLGIGGAGKGTTIEPFSVLLGPYYLSIPIAMLLEDTGEDRRLNYIAALRGVRLAVCNEGSKMRKLDSRGIKALTGGGEITGRRLCHQPTTFVQTHKIVVLANDSPILDLDEAMMQRVLLVPFEVQFRGTDKCRPELRDFFKTPEQLAGILRWMVNGCLEWQRVGLRPPQEVQNASTKYFKEADYFQQFLDDHVELDTVGFVGTEALYQTWCRYCETNGLWTSKGTSKTFVTDLKARCPNVESGVRFEGKRGLRGLKLKETKERKENF